MDNYKKLLEYTVEALKDANEALVKAINTLEEKAKVYEELTKEMR